MLTSLFMASCCIAAAFGIRYLVVTAANTSTSPSAPGVGPYQRFLSKCEAEDLLDWLEAHGRRGKLTFQAGRGFTIE